MKSVTLSKYFLCAFLALSAITASAKAPEPVDSLAAAFKEAAKQNKMAFILLGRPACGNCNATKEMIRDGKISVTDTLYVTAYLNCDIPKESAEFMKKYSRVKFGKTLPFVVITDSKGTLLATSGGYKDAAQWNSLLEKATAASSKSSAASATGTAASPFGTLSPGTVPANP